MANIRYSIQPLDGMGHYYQVDLYIARPNPKGQIVRMPSWIPGSYMIRDFSKHVREFTVFGQRTNKTYTRLVEFTKLDSDTWLIPNPTGPLLVSTKIYAFDHSVRTAFLDNERGFFNFSSLCLQVENQTHLPIDCDIVSTPLTKGWEVITSLPIKSVNRSGFGLYHALNYETLIDHPVSLGCFTKLKWRAYGIDHQMVFQGLDTALDTERLKKDLVAICKAHIAFFEPTSLKAPFSEFIFHVNVVSNGYGGLEHRSSTALICKRSDLPYLHQSMQANELKSYQDFLGLCSHEYFHAWMVKKVQPRNFQPYQLNQRNFTHLLWLFEGFTSYYDDLQLFRSCCIDLKTYLKRILSTYQQVIRSPGRHYQSIAQSSFDAWTKYYLMDENTPNAVVSYYAKGSLVALALDILIRDYSQQAFCLDDVMRSLWREHGAFGDDLGKGLTENGFDKIILQTLGSSFKPLWLGFKAAYIEGTQDIDIPDLFASQGINLRTMDVSLSERIQNSLGLRTTSQDSMIRITHVLEGFVGHSVGLCPNDLLIAVNSEKVNYTNWTQILTRYHQQPMIFTLFRNDLLKHIQVILPSKESSMSSIHSGYAIEDV